jgi:hypothetical protein
VLFNIYIDYFGLYLSDPRTWKKFKRWFNRNCCCKKDPVEEDAIPKKKQLNLEDNSLNKNKRSIKKELSGALL